MPLLTNTLEPGTLTLEERELLQRIDGGEAFGYRGETLFPVLDPSEELEFETLVSLRRKGLLRFKRKPGVRFENGHALCPVVTTPRGRDALETWKVE